MSVGRGTKNIARGGFNKLGSFFAKSDNNEELNLTLVDEENDITVIDGYDVREIDISIVSEGVGIADIAV